MTEVRLDGGKIRCLPSFIAGLAEALGGEGAYFGWELTSLADCLHGGYLGEPPYDIVIVDGLAMLRSFDADGMVRYCDSMLEVIDAGGRGMVQEESRSWHLMRRDRAVRGIGDTLFDALAEVIMSAPASLTVLSDDGTILSEVRGVAPRVPVVAATDSLLALLAKQGVITRLAFRFEEERIKIKHAPDLGTGRESILAWIDSLLIVLRKDLDEVNRAVTAGLHASSEQA